MTTPKQTLSQNSLGILEKTLLSEAIKVRRKEGKGVLRHSKIYHIIFRRRETIYNQILGELDFYRISNQEDITQQKGNQKPF